MQGIVVAVLAVWGLCNAATLTNNDALQERAVENPTTPNQILDAIFERALAKIQALGWDQSKNVQNGETTFNFTVDSDGHSDETFIITSANITGLGNLTRSKSGSFSSDESILEGTAVIGDLRALANYQVIFPGFENAPSQDVTGRVIEYVNKIFADIEINMQNGVPQSIRSYSVRLGQDQVESVTNLDGNDMEPLHTDGFRRSLRQIIEDTMNTNIQKLTEVSRT